MRSFWSNSGKRYGTGAKVPDGGQEKRKAAEAAFLNCNSYAQNMYAARRPRYEFVTVVSETTPVLETSVPLAKII